MRRKLWLILLVVGCGVSARPMARGVKRCWVQWSASKDWKSCRMDVVGGGAGEPCGWLKVPEAGINQMVLAGVDKKWLALFPCCEQVGRATLIMAHRDSHFMGLEKIQLGDSIQLEQRGGKEQAFECVEIYVIEKDEVRALIEKYEGKERLLLLTCFPFNYIGPAPKRFLVVARPVRSTF